MLSLWANWLQLNSQLNSSGVSFCLYRSSLTHCLPSTSCGVVGIGSLHLFYSWCIVLHLCCLPIVEIFFLPPVSIHPSLSNFSPHSLFHTFSVSPPGSMLMMTTSEQSQGRGEKSSPPQSAESTPITVRRIHQAEPASPLTPHHKHSASQPHISSLGGAVYGVRERGYDSDVDDIASRVSNAKLFIQFTVKILLLNSGYVQLHSLNTNTFVTWLHWIILWYNGDFI